MPLVLRKGLETNRKSFTPENGEPIWVTDTKKLYVGDGSTAGGIPVGGSTATIGSIAWTSIESKPSSFTPSAHKSTHATGGSDALSASDIGLGNVANTKHNFSATSDPGTGDDSGDGYSVGSQWINTTDGGWFVCVDASSGAASWVTPSTSASLGTQPLLKGARISTADISTSLASGSYTLDKDYDDFVGTLTGDAVITVPSGATQRWSPVLELAQDSSGNHNVVFQDADGNVIPAMGGTLTPWTSPGNVNIYTLYYSQTQAVWGYACINQLAAPVEETSANVYDIDSQTAGAIPSNTTVRWRTDALTINKDTTYADSDDRCFSILSSPSDNEFRFMSIDDAATPTDVEVLALVRDDGTKSSYNSTVFLRGSDDGNSGNAYGAGFVSGTIFRLYRVHSNTTSTIKDYSFSQDLNTEYWIRFQAIGTSLKAKVWAYGTTEPASWSIEETDANLTSGYIGYGTYQKTGPHKLCYFAWRTDGDTVSLP